MGALGNKAKAGEGRETARRLGRLDKTAMLRRLRNVVRRDLRVCLNNRGSPSFPRRALVTMPHMERSKLYFVRRTETYI